MILITGKKYDVLKFIALVFLPALGAAYFGLAEIWGLPAAEQVAGTILVLDTFLGTILQLSSNAYAKSEERFDGAVYVNAEEDSVGFRISPDGIEGKDEIRLKVNKP